MQLHPTPSLIRVVDLVLEVQQSFWLDQRTVKFGNLCRRLHKRETPQCQFMVGRRFKVSAYGRGFYIVFHGDHRHDIPEHLSTHFHILSPLEVLASALDGEPT